MSNVLKLNIKRSKLVIMVLFRENSKISSHSEYINMMEGRQYAKKKRAENSAKSKVRKS